MKFLVILICLTLNYFWLRHHERFDDRWFLRFRRNMEAAARRIAGNAAAWWPSLALIYAIPLLSLALPLWLVRDQAFGLPTMLVHILVVLLAFDRIQMRKLSREFLALWSEGDREATLDFLRRRFPKARGREFANDGEIAYFFRKRLIYRSFEKMFVQFFWYMAAGPYGVLASYVTYQLRDSGDEHTHPKLTGTIEFIIHALEWIPLRLVALTFSLAGNFVHCFNQLKQSFWEFDRAVDNDSLLYSFAGFALFGGIARETADGEEREGTAAGGGNHQAWEIESLQALLERCQILWLGILALFTIFGPVF